MAGYSVAVQSRNRVKEARMSETKQGPGSDATSAMEPARLLVLNDLVAYAEGSIVSRALARSSSGSLTLFAFDAGQHLSEHTSPFDALVQVLDGSAELVIGGQPVSAEAGQAVLMPAGVPHAVNARRRFKMLLTMLAAPTPSAGR
jgi:quercetin dioxygenase-like cupin family protein